MRNLSLAIFTMIFIFLQGCIGDDFIDDRVDPVLRIDNPLQSLATDTLVQLSFTFRNNVGQDEVIAVEWDSDDETIATVSSDGVVEGLAMGTTTIYLRASYEGEQLEDSFSLEISQETMEEEMAEMRTGNIDPSSFYPLDGDFTLTEEDGNLILEFADNYLADTALPGLYVYLTNNPNSVANALIISEVTIFNGAHSYEIPNVGLYDYSHVLYFCKPFNVKVGDGAMSE